MARKYPLQPLQEQREQAVDREAAALAGAERGHQAAGAEHARAKAARERAEAAAQQQQQQEVERMVTGRVRAVDMARHAQAGQRARTQVAALSKAEQSAARAHAGAHDAANRQRTQLAVAESRSQAVAKDRQRWHKAQQRGERVREETSAEEYWLARKGRERKP